MIFEEWEGHMRERITAPTEEIVEDFRRTQEAVRLLELRAQELGWLRRELAQRSCLIPCPKPRCNAEADKPCTNLNTGARKSGPHDERVEAYFALVGCEVVTINPYANL